MTPNRASFAACAAFLLATVGCERRSEVAPEQLEIYTVVYQIPPNFISDDELGKEVPPSDPFTKIPGAEERKTAKEILIDEGITFPEGTAVLTGLPVSGVGLRNTGANHERMRNYLDREFPGKWRIY